MRGFPRTERETLMEDVPQVLGFGLRTGIPARTLA